MLYSELLSAALCQTLRHLQAELLLNVKSEGAFQMVTDVSVRGEFTTLRQAGTVDLYQKQEAIYKDFAVSMESVTHGVQKFPQQCFITDVSVSY